MLQIVLSNFENKINKKLNMGTLWIWRGDWGNRAAGSGAVPGYQRANDLHANNVIKADFSRVRTLAA